MNEVERWITSFDKKFLHANIRMVVEELAGRCFAVPTSTTSLLVVRFHTAWNVEVHDKTNIRSIYSHPERIRRHHNIATALHEFVLRSFPLFVVHPSVVKDTRDLCPLKSSGDGFHSFSRRAINNSSLVSLDQR